MDITIEQLHEMLGRIERELAAARSAMAELAQAQNQDIETWGQYRMKQVHDRSRQLQPIFDQIGNTLIGNTPAATAEEVQQMMLVEGVDPAARLGSSGILEMREE